MSASKLITPGKWYVEYDENGERTAYVYEDSACKLLGFDSREEYIEVLGSWDNAIHPEDEERVNQSIALISSFKTTSLLTPMATRTDTFSIPPPQLRFR